MRSTTTGRSTASDRHRRFTVSVTGEGVDVGTLEQYAGLVDLSKLEAMKDAGVHAQQ